MGGNIFAESTYGVGSVFRFSAKMSLPEPSILLFADNPLMSHKRVLLVCVNEKARESYKDLLVNLHMEVSCIDPEQLMLDVSNRKTIFALYDFVLVDFSSRLMQGDITACNILQSIIHQAKKLLVLMTAAFLPDDINQLVTRYANIDFIVKPLTPQKLEQYFSPQVAVVNEAELNLELSDFDKIRLKHMRVILVEDNIVNRLIAVSMLKKYGIEVLEREQGKQAVDTVLNEEVFIMPF